MSDRESLSASHAAVIREYVESGGYEVARASDGNLSAFPAKVAPVLAALAALEQELAEWQSGERLPVLGEALSAALAEDTP